MRGLFDAQVRREGTDVTVVAYGAMVKTALKAADTAAGEGVFSRLRSAFG